MAATHRTLLGQFTQRLESAGIDSPRLSAEILLAHSLKISRSDLLKKLIMEPNAPLTAQNVIEADTLIARRERGEPAAYILGAKEFYGRNFTVTPATLIPRPETETLIDTALAFAATYHSDTIPLSFTDLGTGSGAIAITIALELPTWHGVAVDISPAALSVAQQNAVSLSAKNLEFAQCDFLNPSLPNFPYAMVLSNPPYVSEAEYNTISPEVKNFEPKNALVPNVAEANGLEHLLGILHTAEAVLVPGGLLLLEMGCTQSHMLMEAATALSAWGNCRVIHDLAGLPRLFHAIRA